MAHLPDLPSRDRLRGGLDGGPVTIRKIHHVHDAGPLGGIDHFFRIRIIQRERLLAEHMLAGLEAEQGDRRMECIGGDDRHGIKVRARQHVFGARERLRDFVLFREGLDAGSVHIACGDDPAGRVFGEAFRVPVGHSTGADDREPDDFFDGCFHENNP